MTAGTLHDLLEVKSLMLMKVGVRPISGRTVYIYHAIADPFCSSFWLPYLVTLYTIWQKHSRIAK